jgi:hypothetical protein
MFETHARSESTTQDVSPKHDSLTVITRYGILTQDSAETTTCQDESSRVESSLTKGD